MTSAKAKALGYEVFMASSCEVGLSKEGTGVKTWWAKDFACILPELSHPLIREAIESHEELEKRR